MKSTPCRALHPPIAGFLAPARYHGRVRWAPFPAAKERRETGLVSSLHWRFGHLHTPVGPARRVHDTPPLQHPATMASSASPFPSLQCHRGHHEVPPTPATATLTSALFGLRFRLKPNSEAGHQLQLSFLPPEQAYITQSSPVETPRKRTRRDAGGAPPQGRRSLYTIDSGWA